MGILTEFLRSRIQCVPLETKSLQEGPSVFLAITWYETIDTISNINGLYLGNALYYIHKSDEDKIDKKSCSICHIWDTIQFNGTSEICMQSS